MVEFLAQPEVCELLINYITQCDRELARPTLKDEPTEELKAAHKVTMLLTADDPSEGLKWLLSRRSAFIMSLIMDIFEDTSSGSFYHAYRLVDLLVRLFPLEVLTALCSDGDMEKRMMSMLRYLGYPPVAELVAMLVSLSPVPRGSVQYENVAEQREDFIGELQSMDFLTKLVDVVVSPESVCVMTEEVTVEVHSQFACQLFQECLEKLSLEELGETLLVPFIETSNQLERMLNTITDPNARGFTRRNCTRMLDVLLRQASEPELMSSLPLAGGHMGMPQTVANRLYPLRDRIIEHLASGFEGLMNLVLTFEPTMEDLGGASGMTMGGGDSGRENFVYSTHAVGMPFSTLRINFMDLVALLVESDEDMALKMTGQFWRRLLSWCAEYAHNNIFHSICYRLIFSVLRQQLPIAQKVLFEEGGLVDFLADNFLPLPQGEGEGAWKTPPKGTSADIVGKYVMRGMILNTANACRLHSLTLSPSSFLRSHLTKSAKWQAFYPELMRATMEQRSFGLGIAVNDMSNPLHSSMTLSEMMTDGEQSGQGENSLGLGSHFAHNLGFYDELCWEDAPHSDDEEGDGPNRSVSGENGGTYLSLGGDRDSDGGLHAAPGTPNSSGGRDSLGSPDSGRDSRGSNSGGRLSGGGSYGRSPLSNSMYVPSNMADDESDVIDGILGPSSPAAVKILNEGGSPSSPSAAKQGTGSAGSSPSAVVAPTDSDGSAEAETVIGAQAVAQEEGGGAVAAALDMDAAAQEADGDGDGEDIGNRV